jgi:DNA-binding beta-propeller fold protein YncE
MTSSFSFWGLRAFAAAALTLLCLVSTQVKADLLVSDNFGNQLLRYDQNTGAFIGALATGGQLNGPVGMLIDGSGNLLVTNQNDNRILKYDPLSGSFLGNFATTGMAGPADLRFGPDGNLYVANFNGNSVSRFDTNGGFLGAYTSGGVIQGTSSFAFNSAGELFVGSFGSGKVLRYGNGGNYIGEFASGISGASGLVFDADGDLWLTSLLNHQVFELDSTGAIKTQFSTNFGPIAESFPSHILFAPGNPNELWISLTGGGGVYKFLSNGTPLGPIAVGGGLLVPGQSMLISAVPEPSAGLLVMGSAVILTGLRRRRES